MATHLNFYKWHESPLSTDQMKTGRWLLASYTCTPPTSGNIIVAGQWPPTGGVVFGTDASGGPKGSDARSRTVGCSRTIADETLKVVGTIYGTLPRPCTVTDGEVWAIVAVIEATAEEAPASRCDNGLAGTFDSPIHLYVSHRCARLKPYDKP